MAWQGEGANGTGGGSAICGLARRGGARPGAARVPMAHGGGSAIRGVAGLGLARPGVARRGEGI